MPKRISSCFHNVELIIPEEKWIRLKKEFENRKIAQTNIRVKERRYCTIYHTRFTGAASSTELMLTEALRTYSGNATIVREYQGFEMVYEYDSGSIVKIVERKKDIEKVIYAYPTFKTKRSVHSIYIKIDDLLDMRNLKINVEQVDKELQELSALLKNIKS
jgi:hypothetical protein